MCPSKLFSLSLIGFNSSSFSVGAGSLVVIPNTGHLCMDLYNR